MKKLSTLLSCTLALSLLGAGYGNPALTTAYAASTSDAHVAFLRGSLGRAGITSYTESDEAGDVAKMKSAGSIKAATKFKFSGGSGSVRLLTLAAKSPAELGAVKSEVKAQYDQLLKLSTSARIVWLDGDATHATAVNWKVGDEFFANQVLAALGAPAAKSGAATPPQPAPAVDEKMPVDTEKSASAKGFFKVGDKVKALWKGGTKYWDAIVTAVSGDEISVKYSDGMTAVLPRMSVAHLNQPNSSIKAGQEVLAKWSDGQYYVGFVASFDDQSVTVKWKDGSAPSKVPYSSVEVPGK